MSTDRELLEQAAKAADEGIVFYGECLRAQTGREWSPLTDDGDALRLAVKLEIQVWRNTDGTVSGVAPGTGFWNRPCESLRPDPYAATRRVIVLAAAQIGKTNQPGEAHG
jgi:hypothetical protein